MKTITSPAFCETEEKKSRFLAFLVPYESYDVELEKLRQKHPKANHHVSAFRYFDENKRLVEGAKDDGEPSGSAGMPALKVLQGNEIVNAGVIIVRYFGGIKLGTGGMARAYAGSVKAVIEDTQLVTFKHQSTITLITNFDRISKLERLLNTSELSVSERRYTEDGQEIDLTGDEEKITQIKSQWELLNF